MSSTKGFSLIATVHIAPENVDKFLEYFQVVFDNITANPECEFFQVYRSPSEPGVLSWVEDWNVPAEWLFEHEHKKEYFKEYITRTEPLWIKPREVRIIERVGPRFLFSKIRPTVGL